MKDDTRKQPVFQGHRVYDGSDSEGPGYLDNSFGKSTTALLFKAPSWLLPTLTSPFFGSFQSSTNTVGHIHWPWCSAQWWQAPQASARCQPLPGASDHASCILTTSPVSTTRWGFFFYIVVCCNFIHIQIPRDYLYGTPFGNKRMSSWYSETQKILLRLPLSKKEKKTFRDHKPVLFI